MEFFTETDVQTWILAGEGTTLEFKRDELRPEQVAREVVAMANTYGGRILIGVEDDGVISGIQRKDLETWLMDTVVAKYVHPWVLPQYQEAIVGGKRIAIITVLQGLSKPYVVRDKGVETPYVRLGSTTRAASREVLARMFQTSGLVHAELSPVPRARFEDLDVLRLRAYLLTRLKETQLPSTNSEWIERLVQLGFMVNLEGVAGSFVTVAGLVLWSSNPALFMPTARVRWMAFAADDLDYGALDDTYIEGPLCPLVDLVTGGAVVVPGLVDRVLDRMSPFISSEPSTLQGSARLERVYRYPVEAIREVLVNALVHRDWTRNNTVEVRSFSDRLEIFSPGALPNSMTVSKMVGGQRSPRNTIINDVMRDFNLAEARGMGVRRKVIPLTVQYCGAEPVFTATEDFVQVSIPARRLQSES